MLNQIQIHPDPIVSQKEKGDFFEALLRAIMETQRYKVTERVNFTGTEIDLLCEHLDRPDETALVECKARGSIVAGDIKNFVFDVVVSKRAEYGYFVHTSELQHQAAGMAADLKRTHSKQLIFWGPDKVIDLLQHCDLITPPPDVPWAEGLTLTKRILLYTYKGRFWVTILSNKIVPTHYHVTNASSPDIQIDSEALKWISELDELQGLSKIESTKPPAIISPSASFDAVAEIQEAEQWDDYRPVGSRYFIGRDDIRDHLYHFVQAAISSNSARRVFFVEGKSGWGKSSLLAHLRARSRNVRNKNTFFVLAVDSRSAYTGEFVSLAVAKLVSTAASKGFIPAQFAEVNVASSFDTLASPEVQELLRWLEENRRVLILIFDQFEDVFRKEDLFRTFHKLMMDVNEQQRAIIVGFSWKSEINIPIDNPAYSLWQQARDLAETFRLREFLGYEVDRVLRQLEAMSGHQLPADLKRRLKEGSQGFPWLTKKLSIHCYHQMRKGVTPEDLVDQNLNVDILLNDDMESLSGDEARALKLIARRAYDGDPFDVAEVDDKIQEREINSLLSKRLIVKSGGKYNVYWDIFRDFLVEDRVPTLGESFLLRQYPMPCVKTLDFLQKNAPCTIEEVMAAAASEQIPLQEGTALNRARELRHLGVVTKVGETYQVRPSIRSLDDFKRYMYSRLNEHIVVRALRKIPGDTITYEDVVNALRGNFKGYGFSDKTWRTYAGYLIAWLRYSGLDFGRRLTTATGRKVTSKEISADAYTPQWRPDKAVEIFLSFKGQVDPIKRPRTLDKGLYDLKALGLIIYEGDFVYLTKRGIALSRLNDIAARREIARLALSTPKIRAAYDALRMSRVSDGLKFEEALAPVLDAIPSASYRKTTMNVLRSWARFVFEEMQDGGG